MTDQKEFNQKAWAVLGIILFLIIVYSALTFKEGKDCNAVLNNPNADCPSEFEMRGGDTW